mmetsp:Transcript_34272/g.62146  ORF Transcript_34272/g.62146 Transcript_34272/m.62146 type:complete len:96 (+) Transcript_34272:187-474(+)
MVFTSSWIQGWSASFNSLLQLGYVQPSLLRTRASMSVPLQEVYMEVRCGRHDILRTGRLRSGSLRKEVQVNVNEIRIASTHYVLCSEDAFCMWPN